MRGNVYPKIFPHVSNIMETAQFQTLPMIVETREKRNEYRIQPS